MQPRDACVTRRTTCQSSRLPQAMSRWRRLPEHSSATSVYLLESTAELRRVPSLAGPEFLGDPQSTPAFRPMRDDDNPARPPAVSPCCREPASCCGRTEVSTGLCIE